MVNKSNKEGLETEIVDTIEDVNLSSNGKLLPMKNTRIALIDA